MNIFLLTISGLITKEIYCVGILSPSDVILNDVACRQIYKPMNIHISTVLHSHFSHWVFTYKSCSKLSYKSNVFSSSHLCVCVGCGGGALCVCTFYKTTKLVLHSPIKVRTFWLLLTSCSKSLFEGSDLLLGFQVRVRVRVSILGLAMMVSIRLRG